MRGLRAPKEFLVGSSYIGVTPFVRAKDYVLTVGLDCRKEGV
jgi:hypothetical protein